MLLITSACKNLIVIFISAETFWYNEYCHFQYLVGPAQFYQGHQAFENDPAELQLCFCIVN